MTTPTPDLRDLIRRLGGAATYGTLSAHVSRRVIAESTLSGQITRSGRGMYVTPETLPALAVAAGARAIVSGPSAAALHGLKLLNRPDLVHLKVDRTRRIRHRRAGVAMHYGPTTADERRTRITSPLRTVVDCARLLPFPEALVVADCAVRQGLVTPSSLRAEAASMGGPGSGRTQRVAAAVDGRSESPIESALRGHLLQAGISFVPQWRIQVDDLTARVDLAEPKLKIVAEADSFEFHGSRGMLRRDAHRYNELIAAGWLVLRFAWEHIMFDEAWIVDVVRRAMERRRPHPPRADRPAQRRLLAA